MAAGQTFGLPLGGEFSEWLPLSGQTGWAPIHVTEISAGGTPHTVHTATTSGIDVVWIWASNVHTGAVVVSFEWTGTGVTKRFDISVTNGAAMTDPIINGLLIGGGATIKVFAATTAVINLVGRVQRIS